MLARNAPDLFVSLVDIQNAARVGGQHPEHIVRVIRQLTEPFFCLAQVPTRTVVLRYVSHNGGHPRKAPFRVADGGLADGDLYAAAVAVHSDGLVMLDPLSPA